MAHNEVFFGLKPLAQISDDDVTAYREKRAGETVIRHGEKSARPVSTTTVNKEVGTLRKFLRLARKKGYTDKIGEFRTEGEPLRNRVLTSEEYSALLQNTPGWLSSSVHKFGNVFI